MYFWLGLNIWEPQKRNRVHHCIASSIDAFYRIENNWAQVYPEPWPKPELWNILQRLQLGASNVFLRRNNRIRDRKEKHIFLQVREFKVARPKLGILKRALIMERRLTLTLIESGTFCVGTGNFYVGGLMIFSHWYDTLQKIFSQNQLFLDGRRIQTCSSRLCFHACVSDSFVVDAVVVDGADVDRGHVRDCRQRRRRHRRCCDTDVVSEFDVFELQCFETNVWQI